MTQSRRSFLAQSSVFATFAISGTKSSAKIIGANDRIRVAVCGIKGRGNSHMGGLGRQKNVEISHLVDPDSRLFEGRSNFVNKKFGNTPECVQDVREVLENSEVDVISIATPNHWHSLMSIWACQAGKDVYVEKPLSHNLFEGRKLVEAAKKYGRIVQHGTQNRSLSKWSDLAKEIASGKRGKLEVALGTCHKRRGSIGFKETKTPPSELNFDVWTGPAPSEDYHENLVHYNWHWFWNYGNGDIGNQGVHQMDIARWMIPGAVWPKSIVSVGGRFGYEDQAETANTQLAIFDYGESLLVFDVRGLAGKTNVGVSNQVYFNDKAKQVNTKSHGLKGIKDPLADRGGTKDQRVDIFQNFIEAVRNRKEEHLDAHVYEGHVSSGLCHLANVSYRLGEKSGFNQKTKAFGSNMKASEYLERMQEHLKENGLKLEDTEYVVGRTLEFDAKNESIKGDDEANALLTRDYRAPYQVPKSV